MAVLPKPLTFLARDSYRQRRMRDVAWMLPVIGGVLVLVPLLWPREGSMVNPTSEALIFLFSVWLGLIGGGFALARVLKADPPPSDPVDEPGGAD